MANLRIGRRSGLVLRGGRNRRDTLWAAGGISSVVLAAASVSVLVSSLNAAAKALRPFTVVRTRGFWSVRSDATGASESLQVAEGHAVVSDQASAIGITAVPTPFTDQGSDLWYVYELMMLTHELTTDVGKLLADARATFDSRAMRKVEEGQDLVVVQEASPLSLGAVVVSTHRFLLKLH